MPFSDACSDAPSPCRSCGAATVPLLSTSGTLGQRLDDLQLSSNLNLRFKDVRLPPVRKAWHPLNMLNVVIVGVVGLATTSNLPTVVQFINETMGEDPTMGIIDIKEMERLQAMYNDLMMPILIVSIIGWLIFQWREHERQNAIKAHHDHCADALAFIRQRVQNMQICPYCRELTIGRNRMGALNDHQLRQLLMKVEGVEDR